jgi:hypothetical protein
MSWTLVGMALLLRKRRRTAPLTSTTSPARHRPTVRCSAVDHTEHASVSCGGPGRLRRFFGGRCTMSRNVSSSSPLGSCTGRGSAATRPTSTTSLRCASGSAGSGIGVSFAADDWSPVSMRRRNHAVKSADNGCGWLRDETTCCGRREPNVNDRIRSSQAAAGSHRRGRCLHRPWPQRSIR